MEILVALTAMIAVFLVCKGWFWRGQTKARTEADERMAKLLASDPLGAGPSQAQEKKSSRVSLTDRLAGRISRSDTFAEEEGRHFMAKLDNWLVLAGLRQRYTPEQALAQAMAIWTLGIGVPTILKMLGAMPTVLYVLVIIIFALYPIIKLRSLITARQDSIRAENIFFIQSLYMALSSGMSTIDDAIMRVARTAEEDPYDSILAREFAQAQLETRIGGKTMEQALRDVGKRTGVVSVKNLVEVLIAGIRTGAQLDRTLLEYSDQAREMWRQDMRIYKNKKQPRITIGVVITMFGATVILLTPLLIQTFRSLSGLS